MRKVFLFLAVFAIAGAVAGPAWAETASGILNVSLNMPASCTVAATPIDFGLIADPNWGTGNGSITVNCPSEFPYHIALDKGSNPDHSNYRIMYKPGGGQINYFLAKDAARSIQWGDSDFDNTYYFGASTAGTGIGTDQSYPVYASFAGAMDATAGTYTDTVLVTVHY